MSSTRRSARIQASQPASPAVPDVQAPIAKPKTTKKANGLAPVAQPPSKKRGRPSKSADSAAQPANNTSSAEPPATINDETNVFVTPLTPTTKRRKGDPSPTKPPPFTPTPSAVGLMASSSPLSAGADAAPPTKRNSRKPRLAEPHATNAPLSTPGGSRVVAYTADVPAASEVAPAEAVGATVLPDTTTENLLERACAHLISVDPRLKVVIEKHPCKIFSPEGLQEDVDPFKSLVTGAAAKSIRNKFVALFYNPNNSPSFFPDPTSVAAADIALLRTAGLSGRKAEYVKGLAEKFASGELSAQMLIEASDAEVLERLIAVRGLGRWSVEMFACFALKRMDVFSTGDLGVQRGMAAWLGKDVAKLKSSGKGGKWKYLSEKEMLEHSAKFAPYR
ncbi:3-methyladenine DNA glycosylase [Diplodia intermedia]|uniref:3-methyladenine DNA glycosylase n=1 Tax=Diplodia intermedia TaxID=856260 RepID=A0ABR3T1X7_9PEZI